MSEAETGGTRRRREAIIHASLHCSYCCQSTKQQQTGVLRRVSRIRTSSLCVSEPRRSWYGAATLWNHRHDLIGRRASLWHGVERTGVHQQHAMIRGRRRKGLLNGNTSGG